MEIFKEMVDLNMFDVNIVLVNYNMKEEIDRCLSSLFNDVKDSGLQINVVVVDNASTDGSFDVIRKKFLEVKYLSQTKNLGFGAAQNIGLNSTEAKYHFILNPDTYFYPGEQTIKKLFDFMEKETKIGVIGPKILYPDGTLQFSCYRFPTLWHPVISRTSFGTKGFGKKFFNQLVMKDYDHEDRRPVDWIMGSAMFVRGKALQEVGGFDERFWMYYEDSDLCRRFWEAGWSVYYVPQIIIEHVHARRSAGVSGIFTSIIKNKYARIHIASWLKYMWKWRDNYRYYSP